MYVLPQVAVRRGESIHVLKGPSQGEARPLADPSEVVQRFAALGAQGFHVVDVDQSLGMGRDNDQVLLDIFEGTRLPVIAGGGVDSLKRVQQVLDSGARRVLVGTMGLLHPEWLKEASLIFEDRLVACLDTDGSEVFIKGRRSKAPMTLDAALKLIEGCRPKHVHAGYLGSPSESLALARRIAGSLSSPLSFQGPVQSHDDLARLESTGVAGVVLGPEIYDGRLSFEALAKEYRVR